MKRNILYLLKIKEDYTVLRSYLANKGKLSEYEKAVKEGNDLNLRDVLTELEFAD